MIDNLFKFGLNLMRNGGKMNKMVKRREIYLNFLQQWIFCKDRFYNGRHGQGLVVSDKNQVPQHLFRHFYAL